MLKHRPVLVGAVVIGLVGALGPVACGPPPPTGTGATGGTAGTAGTGGSPGPLGCSADSIGGGGQGGYTSQKCADAQPAELPLGGFQPCTMHACQAAHCIPKGLMPSSIDQSLLAVCADSTTLCVPDDYARPLGRFQVKKCSSLNNSEGRCISTCIPKVNGLMDVLPKANCGDYEVCAPCINPNDGTSTGACNQGCDTGPSAQAPYIFQKCQGGTGVCAPTAIIPGVLMTQLVQFDCPVGQVCAPIQKTQNLKYNFPSCAPSNGFVQLLAGAGPNGQKGGCVPSWLADANPVEGVFMAQDTCQTGEKCAPCLNPLRGSLPTGACPVPLCSDDNGGDPPAVR
jgi:hypothetical protein